MQGSQNSNPSRFATESVSIALTLCGLSAESSMQERTQTGPYTGPLSVSRTNVRSHFIEENAWMGSPRDSVADWGFLHSCCMMDKSQK